MNYLTKRADADGTINKKNFWGFWGYSGYAGGRLMNKPKSKDNMYQFIWCSVFSSYLHLNNCCTKVDNAQSSLIFKTGTLARISTNTACKCQQQGQRDSHRRGHLKSTIYATSWHAWLLTSVKDRRRIWYQQSRNWPVKKIYSKHPHITADNRFSGENVMNFMGENGFLGDSHLSPWLISSWNSTLL